jgi:hypothetical protein
MQDCKQSSNNGNTNGAGENGQSEGKQNRNPKGNNGNITSNPKCKPCTQCCKPGHLDNKCWSLDANLDKCPQKCQNTGRNKYQMYSQEQVESLYAAARGRASKKSKKKKRKIKFDNFFSMNSKNVKNGKTSSDSSTDYSNYSSNYFSSSEQCFSIQENHQKRKKDKAQHLTTEVVGEMKNHEGKVWPMQILFESGTTITLILTPLIEPEMLSRYKGERTEWRTQDTPNKKERNCHI